MIPTFIKAYEAAADCEGFLIAALLADGRTRPAAADDDALIGAFDRQGAATGGMADVHRGGLISVRLGAAVEAGDPVTSDGNSKGVVCTEPAAGQSKRYIGFADSAGVADDIIDVFFAPGILQTPA